MNRLHQDDVSMVCICLDVSFENWGWAPKRQLDDHLPTTHTFRGKLTVSFREGTSWKFNIALEHLPSQKLKIVFQP